MVNENVPSPLLDVEVRGEFRRAWNDSLADDRAYRHEEGGYIVLNADLSYRIERWPSGERCGIVPPALEVKNRYRGSEVVAAFHTHPNPSIDEDGREWKEGPSERDRRWHIRRELRGFVIALEYIYEIDLNGTIMVVGRREDML